MRFRFSKTHNPGRDGKQTGWKAGFVFCMVLVAALAGLLMMLLVLVVSSIVRMFRNMLGLSRTDDRTSDPSRGTEPGASGEGGISPEKRDRDVIELNCDGKGRWR